VGTLDRIVLKIRAHVADVEIIGLEQANNMLIMHVGKHGDETASFVDDRKRTRFTRGDLDSRGSFMVSVRFWRRFQPVNATA
jgi:hypothetical protein